MIPLTVATLVLSTVAVSMFGQTPPDLGRLSLICFGAGFCTNAAIVGLYAIIAQAFPPDPRRGHRFRHRRRPRRLRAGAG